MKFAVATLGCKVNQYDSAIIESRLTARGMQRCDFGETADVYVINTCTVTDRADSECLKLARRARRRNPSARIVMTGCLAQANPQALAAVAGVDAVIGLGRLEDLERTVAGETRERVMVSNLRKERASIELGAVALSGQTRAFLKVQEGCDQFCTFCVVPIARGISRSVEPRRIIETLDELAARGFREVTISGVHLGGYGRDLDPPASLLRLLDMIADRSPIGRVRISSLDPEELTDEIIDLVARSEKFCPHLHLPLQAGEDRILGAMRRRYDTLYYRDRVERVLMAMPDAAIGTDVIAGFPGETVAEFEAGVRFLESLPLAYFHVFPYSPRASTTAARYDSRVSSAEVKRRAQLLRELGDGKRAAFAGRFCGARLNVLLEERSAHGMLAGYSRNYLRVMTTGPDELTNHEVEVEASIVQGAQLVGRIVPAQRSSNGRTGAQGSA
jgi:threonylcarbamoyladenosine tRNA methylthiotransferase MtaB